MSETQFLREPEPRDREQSLEAYLKLRLQSLDRVVAGYTSVPLAGLSGNVDLSPTQAKHRVIVLTGAPSGAVTVRIPATTGANADPLIVNTCTGGSSTVTIKSTGANAGNAAGVSLPTGQTRHVRHDGESAYAAAPATDIAGDTLTSYTPTCTPASGSITALGTRTGRYRVNGKICFFEFNVTITTNGTAAGYLNISLPMAAAAHRHVAPGAEAGVTGKMLKAQIDPGASVAIVTDYNNAYPGGNGHIINVTGWYEVA